MFQKQLLFGILCFFLSIPFIVAQNFPDAVSSAGLVLEGTLDHTTTEWSADQKMIYTLNWVKIKSIFQGQTKQERLIPVLSEGGAKDEGLLVVNHAWAMHAGYDYLLAIEPCTDCIPNQITYQPMGSLAEFNKGAFIKEKNKWQRRPNMTNDSATIPCKGALSETDELYIRFSNIHVTDVVNKLAYIDLETRTTQYAKPVESLTTEITYNDGFFGQSVVSNSIIQIHPVGEEMFNVYESSATDITSNKAGFEMNKKSNATSVFMCDVFYQSTINLPSGYLSLISIWI